MSDTRTATLSGDLSPTGLGNELQELLAEPFEAVSATGPARVDGVVIGRVIGFAEGGATPLVTFPGQRTSAALPARATFDLHAAHIGRQALLMFEAGDPSRPIVIGCLQEAGIRTALSDRGGVDVEVDADGKRLVVTAKDEIVLRCGKASITLTNEGKVLIQGTYVSSTSSGAQRIRGGSVQIN
jgi:Domain of unknown function (DUF6484)